MKILHIVNRFDTLNSIAKQYNVLPSDILKFNNLLNDKSLPEKLEIVVDNNDFAVVKNFKRRVLINNIGNNLNIIKQSFKEQGFICEFENENTLLFNQKQQNVYVVGVVENLDDICKKFSLSKQDVIKKNNLKNGRLFIGQILNL